MNLLVRKKFLSFIFILLGILALHTVIQASSHHLGTKYLKFDAGDGKIFLCSDAISLTKKDVYSAEKGFGWLKAPDSASFRSELQRSRDNFTIDFVAGKEISFRANIPAGTWWVTFWIEAGMEDSTTISLFLNGQKKSLKWHAFRPEAEGRRDLQDTYRIFHGKVDVGEDGLQFVLIGKNDEVRLNGFTLCPDPMAKKSEHFDMLKDFKKFGKYNSSQSLAPLIDDLQKLLRMDAEDIFAHYWLEQLQLLDLAEKYKRMMGWTWAKEKTGLGIFSHYNQVVMILDGLLCEKNEANYPFYERALYLRGRVLYWLGEERHGKNEMRQGREDLAILYRKYPDDKVLAMYNGQKIDQPDPCDKLGKCEEAPAWAIAEREALCRIREIAYWWTNVRQAPNGELGGKIDDDVEILRWWSPLILAGDTIALKGFRRLADGVWHHPWVLDGYSKKPRDVEHSSEFIADTAPEMVVFSDDSIYLKRLLPSLNYFENLWTGITPRGHRFFKSCWFSSREILTDEPRNRDHEYNSRAVKAIRYYAWKTRDEKAIRLLHEWSQAWLDAAKRTDKGKPFGIIPASIRFPDEEINGDGKTWYLANMFWDYYDWERHAGYMMLDQLLFTYILTGDEELLLPIEAALRLINEKINLLFGAKGRISSPGSAEWAAKKLIEEDSFWNVVTQWRLLTGIDRYDDLLAKFGSPYLKFRLTRNEKYLLQGLEKLLESTRYNFPLLTSEVLHTDRVYVRGADHLRAMLTGDAAHENLSPYMAVSWEKTDENFTALVRDTGFDELEIDLFSFDEQAKEIFMRIWELKHGNYKISVETNDRTKVRKFKMKEMGQRLPIILPGRELVRVKIWKEKYEK